MLQCKAFGCMREDHDGDGYCSNECEHRSIVCSNEDCMARLSGVVYTFNGDVYCSMFCKDNAIAKASHTEALERLQASHARETKLQDKIRLLEIDLAIAQKAPTRYSNMMSLASFQSVGYLQEVNRLFFHPLGLALTTVADDKTGEIVDIYVAQHQLGIYFGSRLGSEEELQKMRGMADNIQKLYLAHREVRGDIPLTRHNWAVEDI